jgi:hypothetical protein
MVARAQFESGAIAGVGATAKDSGCFPDAKTVARVVLPLGRRSAQRPDF